MKVWDKENTITKKTLVSGISITNLSKQVIAIIQEIKNYQVRDQN